MAIRNLRANSVQPIDSKDQLRGEERNGQVLVTHGQVTQPGFRGHVAPGAGPASREQKKRHVCDVARFTQGDQLLIAIGYFCEGIPLVTTSRVLAPVSTVEGMSTWVYVGPG